MDKTIGRTAEKIGYLCIFQRSTAGAIEHIVSHISEASPSFSEGADYYLPHLTQMLASGFTLEAMNRFGATFTL